MSKQRQLLKNALDVLSENPSYFNGTREETLMCEIEAELAKTKYEPLSDDEIGRLFPSNLCIDRFTGAIVTNPKSLIDFARAIEKRITEGKK